MEKIVSSKIFKYFSGGYAVMQGWVIYEGLEQECYWVERYEVRESEFLDDVERAMSVAFLLSGHAGKENMVEREDDDASSYDNVEPEF